MGTIKDRMKEAMYRKDTPEEAIRSIVAHHLYWACEYHDRAGKKGNGNASAMLGCAIAVNDYYGKYFNAGCDGWIAAAVRYVDDASKGE